MSGQNVTYEYRPGTGWCVRIAHPHGGLEILDGFDSRDEAEEAFGLWQMMQNVARNTSRERVR